MRPTRIATKRNTKSCSLPGWPSGPMMARFVNGPAPPTFSGLLRIAEVLSNHPSWKSLYMYPQAETTSTFPLLLQPFFGGHCKAKREEIDAAKVQVEWGWIKIIQNSLDWSNPSTILYEYPYPSHSCTWLRRKCPNGDLWYSHLCQNTWQRTARLKLIETQILCGRWCLHVKMYVRICVCIIYIYTIYIYVYIYIYTNMLELEYIEGEMSEFICPDKCPNICQNLCHKKYQAVFAEVGMTRSGLFLKWVSVLIHPEIPFDLGSYCCTRQYVKASSVRLPRNHVSSQIEDRPDMPYGPNLSCFLRDRGG